MPPLLIDRANDILKQLEQKHVDDKLGDTVKNLSDTRMQLSIFDVHTQTFEEIRDLLEQTDINRLTPVEALLKLQEIKGKIK